MHLQPRFLGTFVALAALWPAACASGPRIEARFKLQAADTVEATYTDGGTKLSLCNESSISPEKAYSPPGTSPYLKVAKNEEMEKLLAGLDAVEFFDAATGQPHSRAKAILALRWNGRTYVYSRVPGGMASPEELMRFNRCVSVFRLVYDKTQSYHTARNVNSQDLYNLNQRLRREAAEREAAERARRGK